MGKNEKGRICWEKELVYPALLDEISDDAIYLLDDKGEIIAANNEAEKITGFSKEELEGQHFNILFPDETALAGIPDEKLKTIKGKTQLNVWQQKKNKGLYWAQLIIKPIVNNENATQGFILRSKDLTELTINDDKIFTQKNECKRLYYNLEKFIHAAYHDLKAPLSNLEGLVLALKFEMKRLQNSDYDLIISLIEKSVEDFKTVIGELSGMNKRRIMEDDYNGYEEIGMNSSIA